MTPSAAPHGTRLDGLATEAWNADGADLDLRTTPELVALMNAEDAAVPRAVALAAEPIAAAIDAIVGRLDDGGRLIYVGAGTSGRLALVDAAECQSTFAVPPGLVIALIAGGALSAATAQEHAEDDADAGGARAGRAPGRPDRRRRRHQREWPHALRRSERSRRRRRRER